MAETRLENIQEMIKKQDEAAGMAVESEPEEESFDFEDEEEDFSE